MWKKLGLTRVAARIKRIVILANSRNAMRGRCVAGREWSGGKAGAWIRPVSERDESRRIVERERRYTKWTEPSHSFSMSWTFHCLSRSLWDINRKIGSSTPERWWEKAGAVSQSWDSFYKTSCDPAAPLWIDRRQSPTTGATTESGRTKSPHFNRLATLNPRR